MKNKTFALVFLCSSIHFTIEQNYEKVVTILETIQGVWRNEPAILNKACLQGWPLADVWELGVGECSCCSLTDKSGLLCQDSVQTMGLCCTPAFLLGVWNSVMC